MKTISMSQTFKFIPRSLFSYFSLGSFLSNSFSKFYHFGFLEIFGMIFISIFIPLKKIRFLFLGILFFQSFLIFKLAYYSKKELPFTETDLELVQKNKKELYFEISKEIRKGYYISKLKIEKYETSVVIKSYSIDLKNYTYFCNSSQIQFTNEKKEIREGEEQAVILFPKDCKKTKLDLQREKFKEKLISILEQNGFDGDVLDVSIGLLLGDSSYLDKDLKEKIREGGLLHLFAASGLHIGILVGFFYFICKRISFLNYYTEKIFPIFVGLLYLVFLNFPVSLERAFLFLAISFISSVFFRKLIPIDLILNSIFFISIIHHEAIFQIGFQLSYSAVFGILILKEFLDENFFLKYKNFFTENFTISLSAMIGTYLVLIFYFHSFSFGSIMINFLLVPYASFILPILYLSYLIEFFHILVPIFIFKKYFWLASKFLIQKLIDFSITLSEEFSYYLELEKTPMEAYIHFFVLLGVLILLNYILKLELKNYKLTKNLFVVVFSFISLISFLVITYFCFEKKSNQELKKVSANFDYYLVREENKIYLGGTCKYSEYKIKKSFRFQFCKSVDEFYYQTETCKKFAEICESRSGLKFNIIQIEKNFPKKFNGYYFYNTSKDDLSELQKETKTESGKIILFFPYKSKDKVSDWEENKNVLGINKNWKFITFNEL